MVFICAFSCGNKPRKIVKSKPKKMSDFRKADPKFVNFKPTTCAEAIDLFVRHRNLGLKPDMYPECLVHCSQALPDPELDKFHRWIVCPNGDITNGGEGMTLIDKQLEEERLTMLKEAELRDSMQRLTIVEEGPEVEMVNEQDEEKMSIDESEKMSIDEQYISVFQG